MLWILALDSSDVYLDTVSPLHTNDFCSESTFKSLVCSLSPTKLA